VFGFNPGTGQYDILVGPFIGDAGTGAIVHSCETGYTLIVDTNNALCRRTTITIDLTQKGSDFCGYNPIYPGTGNKSQVETDYVGSGAFPLVYRRTYNSLASLGAGWRHSFERTITFTADAGVFTALARRDDGKAWRYTQNASTGNFAADTDVNANLSVGSSNTLRTADDDQIESYDNTGKLLQIADRNGLTQTMTYSDASTPATIAPAPGLLIRVTDSFARQLNFTYDGASRLKTMTDPAGGLYQYGYDANGRLATVTYPDTRVRTYVYNEPAFTANTGLPTALTGIVDENTQRFANFGYTPDGLVTLSEHAGGADRATVTYGMPPMTKTNDSYDANTGIWYITRYTQPPTATTITDALGTVRSYGVTSVQGVTKNTGVDQPCSSGCGASAAAMTYDANGNIASRTDFNGNKMTYVYDLPRNLETQRVEGLTSAGATTPQTRTISTEWHPNWRVVKRLAEPKRITSYAWNGDGGIFCSPTTTIGVMCAKTISETTDANGSLGFSATAVVPANVRTSSFTYNNLGQRLSSNGPRTDVTDVTNYSYYTTTTANFRIGDLNTVTNALGHVTSITAYDAHGRPTSITDLSDDLDLSPARLAGHPQRRWLINPIHLRQRRPVNQSHAARCQLYCLCV
jgi:YD repeat-containing protein